MPRSGASSVDVNDPESPLPVKKTLDASIAEKLLLLLLLLPYWAEKTDGTMTRTHTRSSLRNDPLGGAFYMSPSSIISTHVNTIGHTGDRGR